MRLMTKLCLFALMAGVSGACNDTIVQQVTPTSTSVDVASDGVINGVVELEGLGGCEGLSISVAGPGFVTDVITTAGGSFFVGDLTPGAYQFEIAADGFEPFNEVIVYDATGALDLDPIVLPPATVPVAGDLSLSDGQNPAGSTIELQATGAVDAPASTVCANDSAPVSAEETVVADASGNYTGRVPVRSDSVTVRASRPGYEGAERSVSGSDIQSATEDAPASVPSMVLNPLTGFVNIKGGVAVTSSSVITLQISAFNSVSEMGLGQVSPIDQCMYGDWQLFEAETDFTLTGPDGEYSICVRVRNNLGQEFTDMRVNVLLDSTPPTPLLARIVGGPYISNVSVNLELDVVDAGPVDMIVSNDTTYNEPVQRFAPTITHLLDSGDGSKDVYVRFIDQAGNTADIATPAVTMDTQPPTNPQVRTAGQLVDQGSIDVELYPGTVTDSNFSHFEVAGGSDYPAGFSAVGFPYTQTLFTFGLVQDAENVLQIRAVDLAGNVSIPGQVVISEDSTDPPAVNDLQISNGNERATLRWSTPAASDIDGYWIYYGTQSRISNFASEENTYLGKFADQGQSPIWVPAGSTRTFTISGLPNGNALFATVVAADRVGHRSPFGNEAAAWPNIVTPELVYPADRRTALNPLLAELLLQHKMATYTAESILYGTSKGNLLAWDISDNLNPVLTATVAVGQPDTILADLVINETNDRLYVIAYVPDQSVIGYTPAISVFDISVPGSPIYVDDVFLPGDQLPVAISGNGSKLYMTRMEFPGFIAGDHRLETYDLADPDAPELDEAGSETTTAILLGVDVDAANDILIVQAIFEGYRRYDISGANPALTGIGASDAEYGFALENGLMYVARSESIDVWNVSGATPVDTGRGAQFTGSGMYESSNPQAAETKPYVNGSIVYSAGDEGVAVVDLSIPATPVTISTYFSKTAFSGDEGIQYDAVGGSAGALYASVGDQLHVYDISSSDAIKSSQHRQYRHYQDLAMANGFIASAEGFDGVAVYALESATPQELSRTAARSSGGRAVSVEWSFRQGRPLVYAGFDNPAEIVVLDLSDPKSPVTSQMMAPQTHVSLVDLAITDKGIAAILNQPDGANYRIDYYDASASPTAPTLSTSCGTEIGIDWPLERARFVNGHLLVVNDERPATLDPDVACGAQLQDTGNARFHSDIVFAGGRAYGFRGNALYYQGISDPASLVDDGNAVLPGVNAPVVGPSYEGSYLYGFATEGLAVFNTENDTATLAGLGPDSVGGVNFQDPTDLVVDGNWAVGTTERDGLHVWQIADPSRLEVASGPVTGNSTGGLQLEVVGHHGYFSDGDIMTVYDLRPDDEDDPVAVGAAAPAGNIYNPQRIDSAAAWQQAVVFVDNDTFRVFSANDPADPKLPASLTLGGSVGEYEVIGERIYAIHGTNQVDIVGLDNGGPTSLSTYTLPTGKTGFIAASNGYVFLGTDPDNDYAFTSILVLDVRGDEFAEVGSVAIGGIITGRDLDARGQRLYAARRSFELDQAVRAYDLTPVFEGSGLPQQLSEQEVSGHSPMELHGGNIFIAEGAIWLDYSDPVAPLLLHSVAEENTNLSSIRIRGPHVFGQDSQDGLIRYNLE